MSLHRYGHAPTREGCQEGYRFGQLKIAAGGQCHAIRNASGDLCFSAELTEHINARRATFEDSARQIYEQQLNHESQFLGRGATAYHDAGNDEEEPGDVVRGVEMVADSISRYRHSPCPQTIANHFREAVAVGPHCANGYSYFLSVAKDPPPSMTINNALLSKA